MPAAEKEFLNCYDCSQSEPEIKEVCYSKGTCLMYIRWVHADPRSKEEPFYGLRCITGKPIWEES